MVLTDYNSDIKLNEDMSEEDVKNLNINDDDIIKSGSKVVFDSGVESSSEYLIESDAYKDSAFGIYSSGSNNEISLSGKVEINVNTFASLEDAPSENDRNAYGIVQLSTTTKVELGVRNEDKNPNELEAKYNPEVYDENSWLNLQGNSSLEISVNSRSGNAYGLLQVGSNYSDFNGDLKIILNQENAYNTYQDSYAILVSGDDRQKLEDSTNANLARERTVNVAKNFTVEVNPSKKLDSLRKSRAIEAMGNSTANINVEGDDNNYVFVNGDLHTSKALATDLKFEFPSAQYIGFAVLVLSWAPRKWDVELSLPYQDIGTVEDSPVVSEETGDVDDVVPPYIEEGRINFFMKKAGSYLTGAANGNIDMEVGSGTLWNVTDDSIFLNLRATGGTIDLHHAEERWSDENPYQYLEVKSITDQAHSGIQTASAAAAPAEGSLFILNTDILADFETDGVEILSFDGVTFYKKESGDGITGNGTLENGKFTKDGSYKFNGENGRYVPIELTGFSLVEANARMRHDIRFGDFLDFRTTGGSGDQHYRVRINDKTIADGSLDYTGRVLKFATTPANVKLTGDWTPLDTTAFKYKPKIWKTTHTDRYVGADGTLLVLAGGPLTDDGEIKGAVNSTLFERDDYDRIVEVDSLESTESDPDALDIATGMTDYWVSGYTKEINDPGKTTTAIAGISFNPIYLSTLRKRLGEVRYGAQDGLWAKAMMMKDSVGGIASKGYDQDLYGVSFGYDHLVRNTEEGLWLLGANIRQAHAEQDLMDGLGSGKTDAIGLNAYATWANYQGAYADFVLSADHYRQKLSTVGESGKITGKYNTLGWGASIEVGHMFHTTRNDLSWGPWYNSWWLEPQLQLAFYRVEGEKYTLSSGGRIRQKDADSLIGRAGIVVGKKFNYGEDREEIDRRYSQVYLKAGVKHDFLGDRTVWFGSDRFDGEVAGKTTFYYGLGGDWQFNERMRLYGQIERETGDDYEKDYEVSVGLKYEF